MEIENNNETYLLFVFGDFTRESQVYEVGKSVILSSTDESIKYIYGSYHMIIKIRTDIPFDEFKKFIYETLKDDKYEYFLMPMSEKTSAKLPKDLADSLFDLESNNENVKIMLNVPEMEVKQDDEELDRIIDYFTKELDFTFNMEEEEDIDPMLVDNSLPSMDEILDKMVENGPDSLTLDERKLLDRYANEYK
jgi:hypothetical protein